jgi:hypothetical protein
VREGEISQINTHERMRTCTQTHALNHDACMHARTYAHEQTHSHTLTHPHAHTHMVFVAMFIVARVRSRGGGMRRGYGGACVLQVGQQVGGCREGEGG